MEHMRFALCAAEVQWVLLCSFLHLLGLHEHLPFIPTAQSHSAFKHHTVISGEKRKWLINIAK
jgi:hypothetical protein